MKNSTVIASPAISLDTQIADLITAAKKLWQAKTHIQLGRVFSKLRQLTKKYQKDVEGTGMSYSQATALTGVSHSTAEWLRNLAEICDAAKLNENIFLTLSDSGVNLASERFQVEPPAINREDVQNLDVCDAEAVKKLVKTLKETYPVIEGEPTPTFSQRMVKLEKDLSDVEATTTDSERVQKSLDAATTSLKKQIVTLRSKMTAAIAEATEELASLIAMSTTDELPTKDYWVEAGYEPAIAAQYQKFVTQAEGTLVRGAAPVYDMNEPGGIKKPAASVKQSKKTAKKA